MVPMVCKFMAPLKTEEQATLSVMAPSKRENPVKTKRCFPDSPKGGNRPEALSDQIIPPPTHPPQFESGLFLSLPQI